MNEQLETCLYNNHSMLQWAIRCHLAMHHKFVHPEIHIKHHTIIDLEHSPREQKRHLTTHTQLHGASVCRFL